MLLKEVIDNSIDEFKMYAGDRIEVYIDENLPVRYRKMAKILTRLACLQHVKRKFLDCDDDEETKGV